MQDTINRNGKEYRRVNTSEAELTRALLENGTMYVLESSKERDNER